MRSVQFRGNSPFCLRTGDSKQPVAPPFASIQTSAHQLLNHNTLTRASPLTQWRSTQEGVERWNRRAAPLSLRPTCAHGARIIFSKTLTNRQWLRGDSYGSRLDQQILREVRPNAKRPAKLGLPQIARFPTVAP